MAVVAVVAVTTTVPVTRVLAVQLPSAQFGVVRPGAVRKGSVVVTCCEEREPMVLCTRDGRGVPLLRVVVLTTSFRGARVGEDELSPRTVMRRKAVVMLLRGGKVSIGASSGRIVPLG